MLTRELAGSSSSDMRGGVGHRTPGSVRCPCAAQQRLSTRSKAGAGGQYTCRPSNAPVRVSSRVRCSGAKCTTSPALPPYAQALQRRQVRTRVRASEEEAPAAVEATIDTEEGLVYGLPEDIFRSLSILLASQFFLFVGVGAVIPALPLYAQALGLSGVASGVIISAPSLAMLLLARPGAAYVDSAGRRPAMLLGMAVIGLSDLATGSAATLAGLLPARLGLGAGRVFAEGGERAFLADLAACAPALRGRALALQNLVFGLGIGTGAPLGGWVIERYGPGPCFYCVSAAAALCLAGYTFLPETLRDATGQECSTEDVPEAPPEERGEWVALLADERWRGLAALEVGAKFGLAAKIASVPVLAAAVLPGGAAGAGVLLSAAGLTSLVGAPIGGWCSDRIGARLTAAASAAISGVGLLVVPAMLQVAPGEGSPLPAGSFFCAAVLVWSLGAAAQSPAASAAAQEIAPPGATATALALPRAVGDAAFVVGPGMLGVVADLTRDTLPGAECAVAGALSLLGAVALVATSGEGGGKLEIED